MAIATREVIYNKDDFYSLPESVDGKRYELIDGDLVVSPSPIPYHQIIIANIAFLLECHVRKHNLGRVLTGPVDVELHPHTIVVPDILFISNNRADILKKSKVSGAPDLIVEVLSPSTARSDWGIKHKLYRQYGVSEYWIVDPKTKSLSVLDFDGGGEGVNYSGEISFESSLLPGLSVLTTEIFGF